MNFNAPDLQPAASALVVDLNPADVTTAVGPLIAAGCRVAVADSYPNARQAIEAAPPAILITDLTLGEYNGLQLVIRAKAARRDVRILVLSRIHDPVLQREAEKLGATFVPRPVSAEELSAAIFRTLFERRTADFPPIRPPFERRLVQRRRDVSSSFVPNRRLADRRRPHPVFAGGTSLS